MKTAGLALMVALLISHVPAHAQPAAEPGLETYRIGDLPLESGEVIRDFSIAYMTAGTLNAAKSNAVLMVTAIGGNHHRIDYLIGPGKGLDTDHLFVIRTNAIGNGITTSPSTSTAQHGTAFPHFTLRDMVNAEHRLVTECLNVQHLVAVTGISMGGNASLQWAVSFPDFMDAVIPVVPMAQASRQDAFIWELARQAIMLDPKWRDGAYPADDPPRRGVGVGINIQNAFSFSPEGFAELFRDRAAVDRFVATTSEQLGTATDARDWVYRTWAIVDHDIAAAPPFNGDLRATARSIRARLLLIPNCFDQLHTAGAGGVMEVAANAPDAKVADIDDTLGHSGNNSPRGVTVIAAEVRDLLQRIADGRPGFNGPRFPRHWSRADRCPG